MGNRKRRTRNGEPGKENGERRTGKRKTRTGKRGTENGERRTGHKERGPGTRDRARETGKWKWKKILITPKLNQQITTHSLFCSHISISCFPFSVLVIPAPYKMNHQILLMVLFATRNEGVKQGNQCADAFLFISSKTFLSYSFVLKSKALVIYLVDW